MEATVVTSSRAGRAMTPLTAVPGGDEIFGEGGLDSLFGGPGNDKIFGGPGSDDLRGQDGDDVLRGQGGVDRILGGDGDDRIGTGSGSNTGSNRVVSGQAGADTITGGSGDDALQGDEGPDLIAGAGGDDTLLGGAGDDVLRGQGGDDNLDGEGGVDLCHGGSGADIGQPGCETMVAIEGSPGIGDNGVYPTPAIGPYAYATFRPDLPGFLEAGESYIDPIFGLRVMRVTDHHPGETFGTVPYARNGFASANGERVFTEEGIYDVQTGTVFSTGTPGAVGFRQSFDPVDPDVYYFHGGSRLWRYDLGTGQQSLVRDFGAPLRDLGGSVDWIDRSGRFMVLSIGGDILVYDQEQDVLFAGGLLDTDVGTGWVGISPDAKWLVVGDDFDHRAHAIDHANQTVDPTGHTYWTLCGDHGDLMTATNGKTYLITQDCWDFPHVYAVDVSLPQVGDTLAERQKQRDDNIMLFAITWNDGAHFSGVSRGPMSDWAFVSTNTEGPDDNHPDATWYAFKNEIIMANVLTGEVRRLAHHRSEATGYCAQPRVMVTWDGSGVFYASNYSDDLGSCGYSDLYFIDL